MATDVPLPLVRPRLLAGTAKAWFERLDGKRAAAFENRLDTLRRWHDAAKDGGYGGLTEVSLQPDFMSDVFEDFLGWRGIGLADEDGVFTLYQQAVAGPGGGRADAWLGRFQRDASAEGGTHGKYVCAVELKGPGHNLDRATGEKSAVEQAWGYLTKQKDARFAIVSNLREIRLYHVTSSQRSAQVFDLAGIGGGTDQIREAALPLYYALSAETLLPGPDGVSIVERLIEQSRLESGDDAIVEAFYERSYRVRRDEFVRGFLQQQPPGVSPAQLVNAAQRLMNRLLFLYFGHDWGLFKYNPLAHIAAIKDPFNPATLWQRVRDAFRKIDAGFSPPAGFGELGLFGYNGGLFRFDRLLDEVLNVNDDVLRHLHAQWRTYDFKSELPVELLGHVFEQSITDLEDLTAELSQSAAARDAAGAGTSAPPAENAEARRRRVEDDGERKRRGVYYTPAYITRYIVEAALGAHIERARAAHRARFGADADGRAAAEAWRDEVLPAVRVIDPACGSGAFLSQAFDALKAAYTEADAAVIAAGGRAWGAEAIGETILSRNLFGVDRSPDAVELTKLSLWLKSARAERKLQGLDGTLGCGDSIIDDPAVSGEAFRWRDVFAPVFAEGGFDVVLGNPPYVRQERLAEFKPWLKRHSNVFDGKADLYTYFFERGVGLLKPGGTLAYIVANKWMKAAYGEPLRRWLAAETHPRTLIDFGHAPVFSDVDTFPCIVVLRRPDGEAPADVEVCRLPRNELPRREPDGKKPDEPRDPAQNPLVIYDLKAGVQRHAYRVPASRFDAEPWSIEPPEVVALLNKIKARGVPLAEYAGVHPLRGVVTGLNEAFVVTEVQARALARRDPRSDELLKPLLRGRDIRRWAPAASGLYLIAAHRGVAIDDYPAIRDHLAAFRTRLEPAPPGLTEAERRARPGRAPGDYAWYELQSGAASRALFEQPKIVYQEINTFPAYAVDTSGAYLNNKVFLLPTTDPWLIAVLNSTVGWWTAHRWFPKMIGEAVSPRADLMVSFPIAAPDAAQRAAVEPLVAELAQTAGRAAALAYDTAHWLRVNFGDGVQPVAALQNPAALTREAFERAVCGSVPARGRKGLKGKILQVSEIKAVDALYHDEVRPVQIAAARTEALEKQLARIVYDAFGLTDDDLRVLHETQPPRMPPG